jgi:hypothetical protein
VAWTDPLGGIDVDGAVTIEVFVLCMRAGLIELTGPCGAAPWYIEKAPGEHPVDVVNRLVIEAIGPADLVHSTSWRQREDGVVLSFFVVVDPVLVTGMDSTPVGRTELARSGATAAPAAIASGQVLEHAIRHLAWLAEEDAVVQAKLSQAWRSALRAYVPEPFRNLG